MAAHPNRSTWRSALPKPSPFDIRRARGELTQTDAAELAGTRQTRWAEWESGKREPHWAQWEIYLLRTGQHPTHVLRAQEEAA